MKILCAADVHIGRRPSRLPERIDTGSLSCARAWEAIVDRAISEKVDLLLVAGDLVDEKNRYYEAAGPVEAGVRALADAGIELIAVAGNHDHDTLPWLANRFPPEEFRMLGAGGRWERHTIVRDGRPVLHIDGWSFPTRVVQSDPLEGHPAHPHDGVPVLGLLHADLDQTVSRHAPVALSRLRALPVDFWLLGHIHRAALRSLEGAASVLYPGSPQAMDPGEPGLHGPWLLEIDAGGAMEARQLPLSTVRYDSVDVSVAGLEGEDGLAEAHQRISAAVHDRAREVESEAGPLRYLSLRVRLTGRTALHGPLQNEDWSAADDLEARQGEITALVERVVPATAPGFDLAELARGHDAPGMLARLVLGLDSGALQPEEQALVTATMRSVGEVERTPRFAALDDADTGETEAREILRSQALVLLDSLLATSEAT